jgi:hypothetical protein
LGGAQKFICASEKQFAAMKNATVRLLGRQIRIFNDSAERFY